MEDDGREGADLHSNHDYRAALHQQQAATPAPLTSERASSHADAFSSRPLTSHSSASDSSSAMMDVSDSEQPIMEPKPAPPPPMPMPLPEPRVNGARSVGEKRKMEDVIANESAPTAHGPPKKPRLASPSSPHVDDSNASASLQAADEEQDLMFGPLPVKLWQYTFKYLPPAMLSRCLRVCRTFNGLLTSTKAASIPKAPRYTESKNTKKMRITMGDRFLRQYTWYCVRLIDSNDVWSTARKIWFPSLPKPLAGFTELRMLQLVGGHDCLSCGRLPEPSPVTSVLNAGPGQNGVRVIWPFRTRLCGNCLDGQTKRVRIPLDLDPFRELTHSQDIAVMADPAAQALRLGLTHAIITPDLHFITEVQRQKGLPRAPGFVAFKKHFQKDIDQLVAKDAEIRDDYGAGTAEEWHKGLHDAGKEKMADAARWEKWEIMLSLGRDLAQVLREYDAASFPVRSEDAKRRSAADHSQPLATPGNGKSGLASQLIPPRMISSPTSTARLRERVMGLGSSYATPIQEVRPESGSNASVTGHPPQHAAHAAPRYGQFDPSSAGARPAPYGTFQPQLPTGPGQALPNSAFPSSANMPTEEERQKEKRREAETRLQERKDQIERRCKELKPPIDVSVLEYSRAYQAAIQIARPLTDDDWNQLKPKLLDQTADALKERDAAREKADMAEYWKQQELAVLNALEPSPAYTADFLKPAKELYGKDYDRVQDDLRARLVQYVDEYVNQTWRGNPRLDRDTAPIFVAKTIMEVQRKYEEERAAGGLPAPPAKPRTRVPIPDPFLSLDNMKWLFENKIKSYLASIYSREIFLCAGCLEDDPAHQKQAWFAFEGLIQHYAAKHTTDFSKDNITVHWQNTPWPEDPPFHPQPDVYIVPNNRNIRPQARSTPQARRNDPFQAPVPGNVHRHQGSHTNGYNHGAQGYPNHAYGQSNHHAASRGDLLARSVQRNEYMKNKLYRDLNEVWCLFDDVPEADMLNCVRVHTVARKASTLFYDAFGEYPSVDHFTLAIASIDPMRLAGDLACKTCVAGQTDASVDWKSYYSRIMNVKSFTLKALVNHFVIQHLPNMAGASWMRDMMEVPEVHLVKGIVRGANMDDAKLALVAEAFPGAFPSPLPPLENMRKAQSANSGFDLASKLMQRSKKQQGPAQGSSKKKKKGARVGSNTPARDGSQENEYDPRKPMQTKQEQEQDSDDDLARFDSDIARRKAAEKAAAAAPATNGNAGGVELTPEVLEMLNQIKLPPMPGAAPAQPAQQPGHANGEAIERPPSVGRDDYPAPPVPAAPPQRQMPNRVPDDLAAILANLRRDEPSHPQQQHLATPPGPDTISRSVQRDPEPLYHPYAAYPPYYAPSTPGSDLHAALQHNARQHAHNTQLPAWQAPGAHVSPPRARPPTEYYAQGHGQVVPVQYAPAPASQPGYSQPAQGMRTVWVDEYGREIQPVGAWPPAPASQDGGYGFPGGWYGGGQGR